MPGFSACVCNPDDSAFWSTIGEAGFASGSARSSFGADDAMTAGAAIGVGVESGEGAVRSGSVGGTGFATGASAAAMAESGGAWNIKRITSKAARARSTSGCSGSPMNDGAASAASATIAWSEHRRRPQSAPMCWNARTAAHCSNRGRCRMMGVGIRIGSAAWMNGVMRIGSAARIGGAIRVIGVMGDAAPSVVAARASTQP